jgi:hypothetical protein
MTQLRAYLEDYISKINQILHDYAEDKEMREAASTIWPDKYDPRYLIFKKTGLRFSINPANAGGGDDARLHNEMPQSTNNQTNRSDLCLMLEAYVSAITIILQTCEDDGEMIREAQNQWPKDSDPRRLVFTLFKG